MNQLKPDTRQKRKAVYKEIVNAFETKYSWLGKQAAEEMLLSLASWNIEKFSNESGIRYRNHVMLAWERGWVKSTMMKKMATLVGDDMVTTMGKVTDAALRGSVSGGTFAPPKVLKAPIVISTEFGQTKFEDELLNIFLAMLEEGTTNISLNKVGSMSPQSQQNAKNKFGSSLEFTDSNEFQIECDFVFWGATYDPSMLADGAMRSRFNVVTPTKPLDHKIIECVDKNKFRVSKETVRNFRKEIKSEDEVGVDFDMPSHIYKQYNFNMREFRDTKAYMAARNWWGLETTPEVIEEFAQHMKESRRIATMSKHDRVFDVIFENPRDFDDIARKTGYERQEVYKILQDLMRSHNAVRTPNEEYVIYSGAKQEETQKNKEKALSGGLFDDN